MFICFASRPVAGIVAILMTVMTAGSAIAGGGAGVTFGFGGGPYYGHHHRPPPFYYGPPPPVYYRGPVYVPPPVYVAPPVYVVPRTYYAPQTFYERAPDVAPQAQRGLCREYQSTGVVNGSVVPTYGTACQQPDGTWRIIN